MWVEITYPIPNLTVGEQINNFISLQPLNFGTGLAISPHMLEWMRLLFHAGIKKKIENIFKQ